MSELPIICTLQPDALQTRREGLLSELRRRVRNLEERPDGYRLHFEGGTDTLALVAAVVEAERQCCRFLRFAIHVEPDDGPVYLDLSGPPGTRDFLGNLFNE